jgi:hypothetical protein
METVTEKPGLLVSAAKVVGAAVGTIAALGGTAPTVEIVDDGKLRKKHRHRLPRRQKKALKAQQERDAPQA